MFRWRHQAAFAAVVFATAAVHAEGPAAVIVTGSAQVAASGPEAARDVLTDRGEYWLGVIVTQTAPALQAQLKLSQGHGLLVESLQPDSPAAKAGILPHDILLKADDVPLAELRDLVERIHKVKEGKISLELLRAGKHETIVVSPAKRPAGADLGAATIRLADGNPMPAWIPKPGEAPGGNQPLQLHVIHPGQILPPGAATPGMEGGQTSVEVTIRSETRLPDGWRIEVTRRGREPAKVVVTRDKEKWEAASDDLSKIPEKIRAEVKRLVQPAGPNVHFFAAGSPVAGNLSLFNRPVPGPGPVQAASSCDDLQRQLGEMKKQLAETQKQVQELRRTVEDLQKKSKRD